MNSTIQLERNAFQENEEELQEPRLNPPPPPPGHEAQPHTDRFGRPPCKLVYAVLKIDFIQKQRGAQRHHLLRFLRQRITTAASTTHAASKAKESDRSIRSVCVCVCMGGQGGTCLRVQTLPLSRAVTMHQGQTVKSKTVCVRTPAAASLSDPGLENSD